MAACINNDAGRHVIAGNTCSTREALNNSSMNAQRPQGEKHGFRFSHKINDSSSLILAPLPCATGSSESIRASLSP
jgi:hypothetical protein